MNFYSKMIKLASLLLFAVAAHCFYIDDGSTELAKDKIVGGEYVSIRDVPYQAQILRNRRQICGAAIISDEWLLTAAHCMEDTYGLSVTTGSTFRGQGEKHKIRKIIINKYFDSDTLDNDIALIQVTDKIQFTKEQNYIPLTTKLPKPNDKVKVSGFGKEGEFLASSLQLKSAIAPVIDRDKCQASYIEDEVTDSMFCAGTGETDACQGDSGGPAVIDGVLSGIVSSGQECGSKVYPGVYTQVYRYRDWIAAKTGLDL